MSKTAGLYVAETKPMNEAFALKQLQRQGFDAFYPAYRRERRLRAAGGMLDLLVPLFPRYIFVELDLGVQRWRSVNNTYGIRRLLGADPEKPQRVEEVLAQSLREQRASGPQEDPEKMLSKICTDCHVEIVEGVLIDRRGTVTRVDDAADRVVVLLYLLGTLREVSLPRSAVRRLA